MFSALLPFVLHHLGLAGDVLWVACSLVLALGYVAFGVLVWRRSRGPLAGRQLSFPFSATIGVITGVVFLALLLDAAGILLDRGFGVYLVGVMWTLLFASLMFLRVVVVPAGTAGSR